uniref:Uncharacterized protein n=1 Tax=Alexandrium monilatum TaxID=311494 RepID=A0A7S4Q1F0_9DINO
MAEAGGGQLPRARLLLGGDAVHLQGLFGDLADAYARLLLELRRREATDGLSGTYWQNDGRVAVTRVRRMQQLTGYPFHEQVISRMASYFGAKAEGWWVNHYARGSDVKNMHRDGWGRDGGQEPDRRGAGACARAAQPPVRLCGLCASRHGIPSEPSRGPRLSVIVMGRAPVDWQARARLHCGPGLGVAREPPEVAPVEVVENAGSVPELQAPLRRRWGSEGCHGEEKASTAGCNQALLRGPAHGGGLEEQGVL